MRITVVGIGYVGLSLAILLSQFNEVTAVDTDDKKVEMINKKISPIVDSEIEEYLSTKKLNLTATTDADQAFVNADFVIISTPTNYDEEKQSFDTSIIDKIIGNILSINSNATIVIRSTVSIGYTASVIRKYKYDRILFSPEFLREGRALYDNLFPSRIIVGGLIDKSQIKKSAKKFACLLQECSLKTNVDICFMNSCEAEAVKLFSNTYLALRISFFNELDTYADTNKLNARSIINGLGLDPRIGNYYNNPSFGYGGYCLPKDTKQLLSNYSSIPQNLISSIVDSNYTRKKYIASEVLKRAPKIVGIYRLNMKVDSDNFRNSSIIDIIKILKNYDINVVIYEPTIGLDVYLDCRIISNLESFKNMCDLILANRFSDEISDVILKVYTRDIFHKD